MEYKPWRDMTIEEKQIEKHKRAGNPILVFESKQIRGKEGTLNVGISKIKKLKVQQKILRKKERIKQ